MYGLCTHIYSTAELWTDQMSLGKIVYGLLNVPLCSRRQFEGVSIGK